MLLLAEVRKWEEYKPRIYKIKNILYTCKQKCSMTVDVHMLISCIKIAYKQIFLIMSKYLYFKTEKDSKCSPTFVNYCKILFSTHFLSQSWFEPPFQRHYVLDFFMYKQRMRQRDKSRVVLPTNLYNSTVTAFQLNSI